MWVNRSFLPICSYLPNKFLLENFFVHWSMQVNRQKTTVKKSNFFFEKLCCFFIQSFWKSICNMQIFYRSLFRCKVLRLFVFYMFEVQSIVMESSSSQEENVLI